VGDMCLIEVEVVEVNGYCLFYGVGDRLTLDGPRVDMDRSGRLCSYALSSLMRSVSGLGKGEKFVKCVDKCKYYVAGGSVVFRCRKVEKVSVRQ
jgi:uncharacterized repeat protein (TIGR04076 family)